nr:hypothetical protein cemce18_00010 [uncultured bacterium]
MESVMSYSEFLEWLNKLTIANSKSKNQLKQGERTDGLFNTANESGPFSYFKIIHKNDAMRLNQPDHTEQCDYEH